VVRIHWHAALNEEKNFVVLSKEEFYLQFNICVLLKENQT
jgi:hypothetical protein